MKDLEVVDEQKRQQGGSLVAVSPVAGFGELMKAAQAFARSSIVPQAFRGKPDDAFVALEWGTELGMKPMASLQNIYVVQGRPTLSAQSMAGLVKGRSDYRGMVIESTTQKAKATVKRQLNGGVIEEHVGEFTIEEARQAALTGKDNWQHYPKQMLEARAIAFALRKAYPDVFAGVYAKEEAEDFDKVKRAPDASSTIIPDEKPVIAPSVPADTPADSPSAAQEGPTIEPEGAIAVNDAEPSEWDAFLAEEYNKLHDEIGADFAAKRADGSPVFPAERVRGFKVRWNNLKAQKSVDGLYALRQDVALAREQYETAEVSA